MVAVMCEDRLTGLALLTSATDIEVKPEEVIRRVAIGGDMDECPPPSQVAEKNVCMRRMPVYTLTQDFLTHTSFHTRFLYFYQAVASKSCGTVATGCGR
jgi:hypothetical protein